MEMEETGMVIEIKIVEVLNENFKIFICMGSSFRASG